MAPKQLVGPSAVLFFDKIVELKNLWVPSSLHCDENRGEIRARFYPQAKTPSGFGVLEVTRKTISNCEISKITDAAQLLSEKIACIQTEFTLLTLKLFRVAFLTTKNVM